MRRLFVLGAATMLALPAPALAQDFVVDIDDRSAEEKIGVLSDTLRDPMLQAQAADTLGALSQVLLNLKIAPFVEAMEQATGEPVYDVDPDAELRDIAPEAERLPDAIESELPRAMDRMAGMGDAFTTLLPALRDMARQFEQAVDESAISVR
ncbi:hypothetical protein [Erythrobacter litoralis]|uniref:DUF2059 domain-containing protein n=1 Tax=Erythrobacter litoralis (strain HTCC2594) TaxID=314225 RepID=Q2N7H7_ERYLH|nr:hypothetical protein [Erythrobacter litoralis]ABC64364.1 hypothetical protein ELI_11360 [Erythrobacter litoralis HTCC2594]